MFLFSLENLIFTSEKKPALNGSSLFLIMYSAYNFNLYIKDNCSARPHFNVPLSGLDIQV